MDKNEWSNTPTTRVSLHMSCTQTQLDHPPFYPHVTPCQYCCYPSHSATEQHQARQMILPGAVFWEGNISRFRIFWNQKVHPRVHNSSPAIYPTTSHLRTLRFNSISGYCVRLGHPRGLCPSDIPTKPLPAFLFSPIQATSQLSPAAQCLAWCHNSIGPVPIS